MKAGRVEISDVAAGAAWSTPSPKLRTMRRLEIATVTFVVAVLGAAAAESEAGLVAFAAVIGAVSSLPC